jgi:hypothetical protein
MGMSPTCALHAAKPSSKASGLNLADAAAMLEILGGRRSIHQKVGPKLEHLCACGAATRCACVQSEAHDNEPTELRVN